MRPLAVSGAVLVLSAVATGCDRTHPPTDPVHSVASPMLEAARVPAAQNFVAHLAGDNEVPPRDTRGEGEIKLQLSDDGTALEYRLISSNIDNVFMSHIHVAAAGVNGPIVVFLFGPVAPGGGRTDGVLAHGTITAANLIGPLKGHPLSDLVAAIEQNNAYANVHTNDGVHPANSGAGNFPGGEIRGQIRVAGPTQ